MPTALQIDALRLDAGTQSRARLNFEVIEDYAALMQAGVAFDPIRVVFDGAEYYVLDGFHRVKAARLAGFAQIAAELVTGTLDDALWDCTGVNKDHGLQRSRADVRRAVQLALLHPRSAGLSNHAIADHVGVTAPTVGKVRRELEVTGKLTSQTTRAGRDGRTYAIGNIGKPPAAAVEKPGPGLHEVARDEIADVRDLVWHKRYRATRKRLLDRSPYLVAATSRGHVAILDSAKLIAEQLGIETVHTEHGEAVFLDWHDPRQLRQGIEPHAALAWLAKTACVFYYSDTSKEIEAFYYHHAVLRAQEAQRQTAPPRTLTMPVPAVPPPEIFQQNMPPAPPATVVHFHTAADHWNALSEQWEDPRYVYIGRAVPRHNLPESPWHNPYKIVGADTPAARAQVIDLYRRHITPKIESGELNLETLRGKTLVCWCKTGSAPDTPCHGDVLVELLAAKDAADAGTQDAVPVTVVGKPLREWAKDHIRHSVAHGSTVEAIMAGASGSAGPNQPNIGIGRVMGTVKGISIRRDQISVVANPWTAQAAHEVFNLRELYKEVAAELKADAAPGASPTTPPTDAETAVVEWLDGAQAAQEREAAAAQAAPAFAKGDTVRTTNGKEGAVIEVDGDTVLVATVHGVRPFRPDQLTKLVMADDGQIQPAPTGSGPIVLPDSPWRADDVDGVTGIQDDRGIWRLMVGGHPGTPSAGVIAELLNTPTRAYFAPPMAETLHGLFEFARVGETYDGMADDLTILEDWIATLRETHGLPAYAPLAVSDRVAPPPAAQSEPEAGHANGD